MTEIEDEIPALTEEDFKEFLSAKSYEEQFRILLAHAEKNQKIIRIRRLNKMENYQEGLDQKYVVEVVEE